VLVSTSPSLLCRFFFFISASAQTYDSWLNDEQRCQACVVNARS
jgi:hypothetical protein